MSLAHGFGALLLTLLIPPAEALPAAVSTHDRTLTLVVHGMRPREGDLDPLLTALSTRGHDVHAFNYTPRRRLDATAAELGRAVRELLARRPASRVVLVGYSMGGLVARRAATRGHEAGLDRLGMPVELVTLATPMAGYRSANWSWVNMGLGPRAYRDLGTRSRFIAEPGDLADRVRHLKVETIEAGARLERDGRWISDDQVSPERQDHAVVDAQAHRIVRVARGHVGLVNQDGVVSPELAGILDAHFGPPGRPSKAPDRWARSTPWAAALGPS